MTAKRQPSFRVVLLIGALFTVLVGCDGKHDREAAYLERGKAQYAQKNFTKAALEFRNALQINPTAVESQYYLGLISEQTGDLAGALATFTKVTEQDPKDIPAQLKIGQYALLQDNREQALEKANLVIALDDRNAEAHALRGAVLLRQDKLDEANQEALKAQSRDPANSTAVSVLSGIKAKQGDIDGALALLDAGILRNPREDGLRLIKLSILSNRNDFDGSEKVLRDLIANSPAKNSYKIGLVRLLLLKDKQDDAEKILRDGIAVDPTDKEVRLLLVQFLFQVRGIEAAKTELLAVSKSAPEEVSYSLALSELYARNNELNEAKAILSDIITKDEASQNALIAMTGLARLALSEGDQAKASELVSGILHRDPENFDALLIRAGTLLEAKDAQAAITALRTVLRNAPNSKEALLLLTRAYADSGEEQLTIDAYRNYLDVDPENDAIRVEFIQRLMQATKIDEAEKQIDQILQKSPKFVPALLLRVDHRIIRKRWADAIETANWIMQEAGDEIRGRTALGKVYFAQGKLKEAITELLRVNEMTPGPSQGRAMLVQALIESNQADQAVDILKTTLAKDPTDADALILLGDTYFKLQRPEETRNALIRSIEIEPNRDLPYLKLISLYEKMGRRADAAEAAHAGLKAFPNHPQLLVELGMIEDTRNQFDAAREAYEAALKQQPHNIIASNNLAALIADAWPKDKAQLEQARRLSETFRNSNDPLLLDTLGWVQYRLGNFDDAIALLERSVKAKPEYPQIRYHLGMAYKARGDRTRAQRELVQATMSAAVYRGRDDAILALANP